MGKSPENWIKTVPVPFGKISSKSNISKTATSKKKTSISIKARSKDLGADPTVISSPVRHVINVSRGHTQLEKCTRVKLMHDTADNVRNMLGLDSANDDEIIRLEQAATKVQAAIKGCMARRAFWALKGIIRLQALVRGHLVRRQAVATLSCMRTIIETVKGANLLQTSLKSEKLSNNAFSAKLLASLNNTMSLNIQYDPTEPNSVGNWLKRWSSSNFWDPLPRSKNNLVVKQTKLPTQEKDIIKWTKRNIRRVLTAKLGSNNNLLSNSSENKMPKRSARKISVSVAGPSEKSKVEKINNVNDRERPKPNDEVQPKPAILKVYQRRRKRQV
ncbi:protein IQ-DOMAIN 29-like [Rutidosis leptorrhynchoides]|uniref:protein IQ-DOMAIN 29-like n=1 Tax=Rutidosis leptorrhynchoides TaxID=125765 RepID=UPI003A98D657